MKRMLSLVGLLVVLSSGVARATNSVGLELGLNLASSDQAGSTSGTGLNFGGYYEAQLAESFYIQPELKLINKAQVGSLYYVVVPVLLKGKFETGSIVKPFIVVGPDIGFRISSSSTLKTIDFALNFGGGANFEVSPGIDIVADFRYSLGLANVSDVGGSVKTRGIHLLAGVAFAM